MASTLHLFGKLDECVPRMETFLNHCPKNECITLVVRSNGGRLGAMHTIVDLVEKARKEKSCRFNIEVVDARSAALVLVLYFPPEERIITKKSKGMIHLPLGTFEGSEIRQAVIEFIAEHTELSPIQVQYFEDKVMEGEELIRRGFAKNLSPKHCSAV